MYGPLIIAYLFLGGTAAGGFLVMAACDLAYSLAGDALVPSAPAARSWRVSRAFKSFRARMYTLCLLLLILSMLFLLWDLGVPERALYIFLYPHATVLTFGSISLLAELVIGGLLALKSAFQLRILNGRAHRALCVACCIASVAIMTYTGAFLMSNVGIAFWSNWVIVLLFASSSLSCGLALTLLANYFANEHLLFSKTIRVFHICHLAALAVEAISLALFVRAAFANPAAANACERLLSPDILPVAIVGVVGFGLVIPAVCEFAALSRRGSATMPVADAFCLCGGLLLRFLIITCGVY